MGNVYRLGVINGVLHDLTDIETVDVHRASTVAFVVEQHKAGKPMHEIKKMVCCRCCQRLDGPGCEKHTEGQ